MNLPITTFIDTIATCFTLLLAALFYTKYLELKRSAVFTVILSIVLWIVCMILAFLFDYHNLVTFSLAFLCPFLVAYICSSRPVTGCIKFSILAFSMDLFIELSILSLYSLIEGVPILSSESFRPHPSFSTPFIILSVKVFALYVRYLIVTFVYVLHKHLAKKIQFLLITISSLFFITQFSLSFLFFYTNKGSVTNQMISYIFISCFIVLFICIVICELSERYYAYTQKQSNLEKQLLERNLQYNYYCMAESNSEMIRRMRHDMNNQLQTVTVLSQLNTDEGRTQALNILAQLKEDITNLGIVSYCNIPIVNIIFSLKLEEAKKKNITLDIHVDEKITTELPAIDLSCVLGHLLDHAMDQSKTGTLNSSIQITMYIENHYLVLRSSVPTDSYEVVQTHKAAKAAKNNHITILEDNAKKYNGYIHVTQEKEQSTVAVFLENNLTDISVL